MDLDIRRLGKDDVAAFKAIRIETLTEEPNAFGSTLEDWLVLPDEEWRRRAVENPVFVAFDGKAPVGVMGLLFEGGISRRHRAMLVMVYVRRDYRRVGLAERLLNSVVAFARESGITQIELHVDAGNEPAIQFYRRHGFIEFGRLPNAVIRNGRASDDLLMAKGIEPESAGNL